VSDGSEQAPEESPEGNTSVTELRYYYSPFNTTYTFSVDVTDTMNCVILNGSSIVAQEINRSHSWFTNAYATQAWGDADNALRLYLRNNGDVDTFRVMLDSLLVRQLGCRNSYYRIGNETVDLYSLGNIVFGYYSVVVNGFAAHRIADVFQFLEDFRLDYPDDAAQIDLGRNIADSGQNVSAHLVESLVP